eukprot:g11062.t1
MRRCEVRPAAAGEVHRRHWANRHSVSRTPLPVALQRTPITSAAAKQKWVVGILLGAAVPKRRRSALNRGLRITWPSAGGKDELITGQELSSLDWIRRMRTWLGTSEGFVVSSMEILHTSSEVAEARALKAEERLDQTEAQLRLELQADWSGWGTKTVGCWGRSLIAFLDQKGKASPRG